MSAEDHSRHLSEGNKVAFFLLGSVAVFIAIIFYGCIAYFMLPGHLGPPTLGIVAVCIFVTLIMYGFFGWLDYPVSRHVYHAFNVESWGIYYYRDYLLFFTFAIGPLTLAMALLQFIGRLFAQLRD